MVQPFIRENERERVPLWKDNEDAFHDAYLAVRKQVMFSNNGIEDLESYFFGCYRKILQSGTRDDSRYDNPGDEYFSRLGEADCTEETDEREEMLTGCDRLVRDRNSSGGTSPTRITGYSCCGFTRPAARSVPSPDTWARKHRWWHAGHRP